MDNNQNATNKKSKDKQSVTSTTNNESYNNKNDDTIPGLGHNIKKIGFGQYTKQ